MAPPPRHTLVKVCGITRLEDARVAVEAGADLLGFVLADSPRRVSPEGAARILAALPGARGVAVLVEPTPAQALELARRAGASRVQLHGVDASTWPADFPIPAIFAVGVGDSAPDASPAADPRSWLLCDARQAGRWGGTGRSFDWARVAHLARAWPVLLAGGLSAENVGQAMAAARPFGVDASSRLELGPGVKDADRVRAFVTAVRRADEEGGRG